MNNWKCEIDLRDLFEGDSTFGFYPKGSVKIFAQSVGQRLETLLNHALLSSAEARELNDIKDCFLSESENEDFNTEQCRSLLNELYTWADEARCWIKVSV